LLESVDVSGITKLLILEISSSVEGNSQSSSTGLSLEQGQTRRWNSIGEECSMISVRS